jgi:hypothetical protein
MVTRVPNWLRWLLARFSGTLDLDRDDAGRSTTVRLATVIRVELRANATLRDLQPGGQPLFWWTAVRTSDEDVLAPLSGQLEPDGGSSASFRAASLGTARLEARSEPQQRSGSLPLRAPTKVWAVTIVITDGRLAR